MAVKPQLACFERLGAPGWRALERGLPRRARAGLLVVADGKRGDVPVTAKAYGQALVGETETPWGAVPGLGADAFTANPLLGEDAIEVLVEAAEGAGAGIFLLVRTSNPGAAACRTRSCGDRPLHEELAALVGGEAPELAGDVGLSGVGAVVGATAPQHLGRLRELMPDSVFLIPGIGAQGGRPEDLGPAVVTGAPGLGAGRRGEEHRRGGRSGGRGRGAARRRFGASSELVGSTLSIPRMPDYKPNQIVRVFAVLALIAAVVLVGRRGGDVGWSSGGNGGNGDSQHKTHVSKAGGGRFARASGSSSPATPWGGSRSRPASTRRRSRRSTRTSIRRPCSRASG